MMDYCGGWWWRGTENHLRVVLPSLNNLDSKKKKKKKKKKNKSKKKKTMQLHRHHNIFIWEQSKNIWKFSIFFFSFVKD